MRRGCRHRPIATLAGAATAAGLLLASCTSEPRSLSIERESTAATTPTATSSTSPSDSGEPAGLATQPDDEQTSAKTDSETNNETNSDASDASGPRRCEVVDHRVVGSLQATGLTETSGLVASETHPGVLWAHNDSGSEPGLYALTTEGGDLGFYPLPSPETNDIEDIALYDGRLYLADSGNNARRRSSMRIIVVDEPVPGEPTSLTATSVLTLRYPGEPEDVEAVLVDPVQRRLVALTKQVGEAVQTGEATRIYDADLDVVDEQILTLTGTIDLGLLAEQAPATSPARTSAVLSPDSNVATGIDISASGQTIALRTYATTWIFDRDVDETITDALQSTPCEGPFRLELQGEAIALLPGDGEAIRFITASEGTSSPLSSSTVISGG